MQFTRPIQEKINLESTKSNHSIKAKTKSKKASAAALQNQTELELVHQNAQAKKTTQKNTNKRLHDEDVQSAEFMLMGDDIDLAQDRVYQQSYTRPAGKLQELDFTFSDDLLGRTVGADEDTIAQVIAGTGGFVFPWWGWLALGTLVVAGVTAAIIANNDDDDDTAASTSHAFKINDAVEGITGEVLNNGVTNDTKPAITGTGEVANSTVTVYIDGQSVGTTTTNSSGSWTYKPTTALTEGSHSVATTVQEPGKTVSEKTATTVFSIDTTGPAAGTNNLQDDFGDVKQVIANHTAISQVSLAEHTDDTTPTYSGTFAEKDVKSVIIYDNGNQIATATVNADGTWSFTPTTPLSAGNHVFTYKGVDQAGNQGATSTPWAFIIDSVDGGQPASPAITEVYDDKAGQIGALQQNAKTNDSTLVISGTGTASNIITVFSGSTAVGTALVGSDGKWTLPATSDLGADGLKNLTAQAANSSGIKSEITGIFPIILDTTAPDNGTWTLNDNVGTSTGVVSEGSTIDDRTPTLVGQLSSTESGSIVTIYIDGASVGTTTVDASGKWTFTSSTLANGGHKASMQVTDLAGNSSSIATAVNFIINATGVLAVDYAIDNQTAKTGNVNDGGVTNDGTPQLVGTSVANATVTVTDSKGATVTTVADASGVWKAQMGEQTEGTQTFRVVSIDGNQNTGAATFALNIDRTAPAAAKPVITDDVGTVQGTVAINSTIDDATPTIHGEGAVAGETVSVYDKGSLIGTTTVQPNGTWSFTPAKPGLAGGQHDFTVTMTDEAGNVSTPSASHPFIIDVTAPAQPSITVTDPDLDKNPTASGTAEANSTVTITWPDGSKITAPVNASGNYTIESLTTQLPGTVTVTSTDLAGNSSNPATGLYTIAAVTTPTVKATDPDSDDKPTATGKTDPNATVTITWPDKSTSSTVADSTGNYTIESVLTQNSGTVTATATDKTGATSPSVAGQYIDETSPKTPSVETSDPDQDKKPTATGKAEPFSTVTVTWPDKTTSTVAVGSDGVYTIEALTVQPEGTVTASTIDKKGNTSPSVTDKFEQIAGPAITVTALDPDGDDKPTASGSTEPKATVTITWPDGSTSVVVAGTDGLYSVESLTTQNSGRVTASAKDVSNNTTQAAVDRYLDETAPKAPTIDATDPDLDQKPTATGQAEPNATVNITWPDGSISTVKANSTGSYSVESPTVQKEGTVTATTIDAAKNTSPSVGDKYTPPVDTDVKVTVQATDTDSDNKPTATGTTDPKATVTVTWPDGSTIVTVAGTDGKYSVESLTVQKTGTVTATAKDTVGNTSTAAIDQYKDVTAPTAPSIAVTDPDEDKKPTATGTAEPKSTVTITWPDKTTTTVAIGSDGKYTVEALTVQPVGTVTATATDESKNTSPSATGKYTAATVPTVSVDATDPDKDDKPTATGTTDPKATVTVTWPDGSTIVTVAGTDGKYSVESLTVQKSGTVTATAKDTAGNTSAPATDKYDDITAPTAPSIAVTDPDEDKKPTATGTAEPKSTVTITWPDKTTTTVAIGSDGKYTVEALTVQPVGTVTATATDESKNTSPSSTGKYTAATVPTVSVDATDPDKDDKPTATGTTDPKATVTVTWPDGSTIVTVAGTDGKYSVESLTVQKSGTVTATAKDTAGNTSAPATDKYDDITAPTAPSIAVTDPDEDKKPTATGTAEPKSTVTITWPDKTTTTVAIGSDGKYTVEALTVQPVGTVTATATDESKNTSPSSTGKYTAATVPTVSVDATDPDKDDKPTATGTTDPKATVTVTWPDGSTIVTVAGTDGKYSVESLTAQKTGTVTAIAKDTSGNTSAPATDKYTDVTAPTVSVDATDPDKDDKPTATGTTEANATVTVTWPDGSTIVTVAGADGKYSVESLTAQKSGTVTATAKDAANNTSAAATDKYDDITAPTAPTVKATDLDNDQKPTASGTAEPKSTVTITWPDKTISTVIAGTDGKYSIESPTVQPDGTVTATSTDEAKNTSPSASDLYKDTGAPEVTVTATDPDKDDNRQRQAQLNPKQRLL